MPNERIKMRKVKDILRLHFDANLSLENIAVSLKVSKGTVSNTLKRFKIAGLIWPLSPELTEEILETMLFPKKDSTTVKKISPCYDYIAKEMQRPHVTRQLLFEEFQKENPSGIGRSAFYKEYKKYIKKNKLVMHITHKGGDKLYVDYSGDSLSYTDKITGEIISTQLFVSSWGASSYTYIEATHSQKQEDWVSSHIRMLEYFDCVPHAIVPDNLKSGVITPSYYDPILNSLYYEMAKHYDTAILPARVKRPRDKAVVESNVLHIQRFVLGRLRDRSFFSLEEINVAIKELLEEYNNREMKEHGGKSRKQRFMEIDKPHAMLLKEEGFLIIKMKVDVLVGLDYHVQFDSHFYSVPHGLVRERVTIYQTGNLIEIYHKSGHVARHQKQSSDSKYTTRPEHMPLNHQYVKGINSSWLIFKGGEHGVFVAEAIKRNLKRRSHPEQNYRTSLGIIKLSRVYSSERLNKACQRALYYKSVSYKNIKKILEGGLDRESIEGSNDLESIQIFTHDNLRGEEYYG
jgi:transposase